MSILLHLPFPPSVNTLTRYGKGHAYSTPRYRSWAKEASAEIKLQLGFQNNKVLGPYTLSIQAKRPDKRKRDLGNIEKVVSDVLQANGVIENDCLAEMISLRWVTSGEGIAVRVEPCGVE